MRRALVVGAAGFLGRHLSDMLASQGWIILGAGRGEPPAGWRYDWVPCDLNSTPGVLEAVRAADAHVIFHAAGAALDDFDQLLAVHVAGTARLLDAVRATGRPARVILAGSAAEYGSVTAGDLPVQETLPARPVSRYGIAKAAQTLVALCPGSEALVARVFNVCGPDEPRSLVCGAFAAQIAVLERTGRGGVIDVGDLSANRDFVDVRDAARALIALAEQGAAGEAYNVCSGTATPISKVLSLLTAQAQVPVEARLDPPRAARPRVPRMVGSAAKLMSVTGWTPTIPLEQTLAEVLDNYRRSAPA
jgi:GDP-4-dehydro-6-deoxy-D-mannose reductase